MDWLVSMATYRNRLTDAVVEAHEDQVADYEASGNWVRVDTGDEPAGRCPFCHQQLPRTKPKAKKK
jgi:hypothetical protein